MGLLGSILGRKKLTAAEASFVRREEKILADCLRIIQETDKIDTFFSRYDLAEKTLREIASVVGGDRKCIAGGEATPAECLASLADEKTFQTNAFLSRYFRKESAHILSLSRGQIKKASSVAAIVDVYAEKMTTESIERWNELSAQMMETVEKAAAK